VSAPFFDPEVLKRCVMQPAEAAAFKAKAVKHYVVHVDADGAMLMEEADTDLLRARLIMEVALLRFSRWSLRLGENHKMPRHWRVSAGRAVGDGQDARLPRHQ
jgi:hypothetical protein